MHIIEQHEFEDADSNLVESSKYQYSKNFEFLDDESTKANIPMTSRVEKLKSLKRFRSKKAQDKLTKFKGLKMKNALPNLRPGN